MNNRPVAWRYKEVINCGDGNFIKSEWYYSKIKPVQFKMFCSSKPNGYKKRVLIQPLFLGKSP